MAKASPAHRFHFITLSMSNCQMDVIIQALKVTFNLRSLHVVHPFCDFLCDLRVGDSESGSNMRSKIAVFPKDLDIFLRTSLVHVAI